MHQACITLLILHHGVGNASMYCITPGRGGDETDPGWYLVFSRDV